jgi:hypothetical protein
MNKFYKSFYLVSNACSDIYPDNSLTNFKNKLPSPIEIDENESLEIALSWIGISNDFINVPIVSNNLPSFIITNCQYPPYESSPNLQKAFLNPKVKTDCCKSIYPELGCQSWKYNFEEKHYTLKELQMFFDDVAKETKTNINFSNEKKLKIETIDHPFWISIHRSMINIFNFKNFYFNSGKEFSVEGNYHSTNIIKTQNGKVLLLTTADYENELYFTYQIKTTEHVNNYLESEPSKNLNFPSVIRVSCNNISQQVFNGNFSNDLIVFCPDFKENEKFLLTEFTSKQYVPICNKVLSEFSIKLRDENNLPLRLLPGPATILKMDLRSKHLEKKSFPIRLSSANTKEFKNNTNTIFKVKLPQKYQLSRDWRIALTSISHPNVYSTFLEDEKTRFILFRETTEVNPKIVKIIIPNMQKIYTVDELVKCIDLQMKSAKIGFAELVDNKCKLNLKKDFFASFSNYLLSILGYAGKIDESTRFTELKFKAETNGQFSFNFLKPINLDYLKPNYIMIYTNIVSDSMIGGIKSKLLRVSPIKTNNSTYVLSDFKHKEFYELENTELDVIEVHLRSHDGQPINFASKQDTIVNLEISNYLEYAS